MAMCTSLSATDLHVLFFLTTVASPNLHSSVHKVALLLIFNYDNGQMYFIFIVY